MKYLCLIFILYLYLKTYSYAEYEIKEKNNKLGGITLKVISLTELMSAIIILFYYY